MSDAADASDDRPLAERTAELAAGVDAIAGRGCRACARPLCGHDALLAVVLGYRNEPRCSDCLATVLREPQPALCERALQWILRRDCFAAVWRRASAAEGQVDVLRPACLWAARPAAASPGGAAVEASVGGADRADRTDHAANAAPAARWDAGGLGCGELLLQLRIRLRELPPGAVLALRAEDPGAPEDIPAWCGLTGHRLLHAAHPDYRIAKKTE